MSSDQIRLVAAVVDIIIPTTDTPGALEAAVPQFIDMLFRDWFTPEDQVQFIEGLNDLDAESRRLSGRPLVECSAQDRFALLDRHDEAAFAEPHSPAPPFFARLKELTLVGYYTSRVAQEQELHTVLDAGENEPGGPVMMPPPFPL